MLQTETVHFSELRGNISRKYVTADNTPVNPHVESTTIIIKVIIGTVCARALHALGTNQKRSL